MPRFIKNGPIVPDELVQQLEEDRVVLFCGAGISAGGGLPTFRELVEYCYRELGAAIPPANDSQWQWLDRMLGALESDFPDQMRIRVVERLNRDATDLTLHQAILKLARLRKTASGHRLVTTNFDHFFEQAVAKATSSPSLDIHSGPVLPIPRNDRIASWRSLVYLHGRLDPSSMDNRHLVLTSGDFGRAYLTDAWAARFVARLFAEFTVLFVGYSLNDPVLRYMTDAFAAEDALTRSGRKRGPAYIFVPYKGTPPDPRAWRQRQLEPIFYRSAYKHRALRGTLVEWARARTDYLASVATIVRRYGGHLPSALEPSNAANLVWAVCGRSDDGGHGARVFAGLPDLPPIEWLVEFERRDAEVRQAYEAESAEALNEDREPPPSPPYHVEMLFPDAAEAFQRTRLSQPATELIPWLCRHLENQQLVSWVIEKLRHGRRAHPMLRRSLRQHLNGLTNPAAGYATFWRIVAAEGFWTSDPVPDSAWIDLSTDLAAKLFTDWFDRELAAAMRPRLTLGPSYTTISGGQVDPGVFSTIADPEVALAYDHIKVLLDAIDREPNADDFWASRLDHLTRALTEVFDLYAIVGDASASFDPSNIQRPSIQPHQQNDHHADWAILFDLIWRGWRVIDARARDESRHWIERWRRIPYLGFRRLVLAAVAESRHFSPTEKLESLLNG